jgi:hypothetical protein
MTDYGQPAPMDPTPGRPARDPERGPSPGWARDREPEAVCTNAQCKWNQPDALLERFADAPAGWTWPHHHEGRTVVLHVDYK